jgi:lipopolysaccharide/colanic/teichoic acid biosynthesis glycosyltransferase
MLLVARELEYFNPLRFGPRPSDFISILISAVLGGLSTEIIFRVFLKVSHGTVLTMIAGGFLVALIFFFLHQLLGLFLHLAGHRVRLLSLLTTRSHDLLIEDLRAAHLLPSITILPEEALLHLSHDEPDRYDIDVIITDSFSRERASLGDQNIDTLLIRAKLLSIPILDVSHTISLLTGRVRLDAYDIYSFISGAKGNSTAHAYEVCKIWLEPFLAFILLILCAPFGALIALAIKITSPGPIFYTQKRVGLLGKEFTLFKFRSMVVDAEKHGIQLSGTNDKRVTAIGHLLRRSRLDEVPQLLNILKGEMSFIGPRPERPEVYQLLKSAIPLFELRTLVRPGLTGWAQVVAGYAASISSLGQKLEFDLYYMQHCSPRLDFIVLVKTFFVVIRGDSSITQTNSPLTTISLTELQPVSLLEDRINIPLSINNTGAATSVEQKLHIA